MVGDAIISEAEHPKVDTCTFCDSSLQLDVKFCPFCGKKIQFESAEIFKDHQKSTEPTPVVEPQENTAKADEIPKVAQDLRDSVVAVAPEERKDRTAEASKYPQTHTDQPAVVKSEEGESGGKHGSIPIQVSSDSKPYKRKWLAAIAILLCCLAVILVLINSPREKNASKEKPPATTTTSDAIFRNASGLALEALREGNALSVTISKLPKLERVLAAAKKLHQISPRYESQVTSAENTKRGVREEMDRCLIAYVGKIVELNCLAQKYQLYALEVIRNRDNTPREKIVADMLSKHLAVLRTDAKADPVRLLTDYTQNFSDFLD